MPRLLPRARPKPPAIGLLDLTAGDCRWPIDGAGPTFFCGEPAIDGCSWCAAHRAVVFAKPAERSAAGRRAIG